MAAMKPRTGDGPLEVTKEGRGIVMRVPLEGGGRLVVELTPDEATALGDALKGAVGWALPASSGGPGGPPPPGLSHVQRGAADHERDRAQGRRRPLGRRRRRARDS